MVKIVHLSGNNTHVVTAQAGQVIKEGGVVVYPTETLYGLGADAMDRNAVADVCKLKGRPENMPIPVIVSSEEMLDEITDRIGDIEKRLISEFWPGPLTIIFNARGCVPGRITGGTGSVGTRIPGSDFAIKLANAAGRPITATSANAGGLETPGDVDDILKQLKGEPDLALDIGPLRAKIASTVVDARDGKVKIIRRGAVTLEAINEALKKD